MITANPVLKRGRTVWDKTKIPRSEFENRLEKLKGKMADNDIQLLLIYGDLNDYGDICWISGYVPKRGWAVVAVPGEGQPVLLCGHGSRETNFTRTITWIEDIRAAESLPVLGENLRGLIGEKLSNIDRAGLTGFREKAAYGLYQTITDQLAGYNLLHTALVTELRQVKSPIEINCLKDTAGILRITADQVKGVLPGGIPEYEFRAMLELRARELGAEDVRVMLATPGTKQRVLHLPSDERLQPGTWLQCYVAVAKDRYWSDMAICLPVGVEDSVLSEMNLKFQQRVLDFGAQLLPGSNLGEIATKLKEQNELEAPGFHLYGLGGGIGLSINEQPYLRPDENGLLSAGMAISVNFLQGHQDKTCLFKATFIITDHGCEQLYC